VFAGPLAQARRLAGPRAEDHDLHGATMLPGFIDAHSHFAMAMQMASGIDLSDPASPISDIPSLLGALKAGIAARNVQPGGWVIAWQYDDNRLAEHRHVTRAELDTLGDYKIVLVHFTGHGLAVNSAAMAAAGITEDSPNPPGGITLRGADGKLSGVFFENAAYPVYARLPQLTAEQRLAALDAAQIKYASNGFTHMQDGASNLPDVLVLKSPAAGSHLKLDLAMLPASQNLDALFKHPELKFGSYEGHVKLEGIKFILDGSPQARTGFFTRDYRNGAPDGHMPWHGTSNMTQDQFNAETRRAFDKGWQLFVHANGDAAIDMAIKGFDALGIKAKDNRRPIVIHSQFQRPDQLADYARIGVGPAYFSNHTYYFADIHRTNFPPEVVNFISPFKAAMKAGLHPSNHSDSPVTPLDPFTQLWSSMARTSLTGVVSGADQRLSAYEGLQMLTTGPAWQVFEENRKGRIKAGLLADFVVLDRNPLTTPLGQIRSIKVMMTVKEGAVVWRRD
jgi:predicted amidohydrolase YtcJ